MDFNTQFKNVPLEMEVKKIGPASIEDIDDFKDKAKLGKIDLVEKSEEVVKIESIPQTSTESTSNMYFFTEKVPEMPVKQEIPEKNEKLESIAMDLIEKAPSFFNKIKEIFKSNQNGDKKSWFLSKTIISNVFAAVGCLLATLISDHPETSAYLPASVLAVLNLYLRFNTKQGVSIPMENQIKRVKNKITKS